MSRPVVFVLAGVNGAGKSSIGGCLVRRAGLDWFNPDAFARGLVAAHRWPQEHANAAAWNEGYRRLHRAIERRENFAFETTLGGRSITDALIEAATSSHDVVVWFCGLDSIERHIARVRACVAAGGHDIPEDKIRERFDASRRNLLRLLPHLARLQVYDNSRQAERGKAIPDPVLVLAMTQGLLLEPEPRDAKALTAAPEWSRPLVEAAIRCSEKTREKRRRPRPGL